MDRMAPLGPIYQAGTLSGNPLAMSAGIATLSLLRKLDPYAGLEALGRRLEEGLLEGARQAGIPLTVNRVGSMLTPFFAPPPVTDFASAARSDTSRYARFFRKMLDRGIYLPPAQYEALFLGVAHTGEDIDRTVDAARQVFGELGG